MSIKDLAIGIWFGIAIFSIVAAPVFFFVSGYINMVAGLCSIIVLLLASITISALSNE